jgi:L-asparaginase
MEIAFIAVGGTIDATQYDFTKGRVVEFGDPAVAEVLQKTGIRDRATITRDPFHGEADIVAMSPKDSLDMTDNDRLLIAILCLLSKANKIVITHGTDTMVQTGLLLQEHVSQKTIVLVGAMQPYYTDKTAVISNVGTAIQACMEQKPGVYIAAEGRALPVQRVQKVREAGNPHFAEVPEQEKEDSVARAVQGLVRQLVLESPQAVVIQIPACAEVDQGREFPVLAQWVRAVYYMAGYPVDSLERYMNPVNHTEMCVVQGEAFDLKGDVLLASGNELIDLEPKAYWVVQRGSTKEWVVLVCHPLGEKEFVKVEQVVGSLRLPKKSLNVLPVLQRTQKMLEILGETLFVLNERQG